RPIAGDRHGFVDGGRGDPHRIRAFLSRPWRPQFHHMGHHDRGRPYDDPAGLVAERHTRNGHLPHRARPQPLRARFERRPQPAARTPHTRMSSMAETVISIRDLDISLPAGADRTYAVQGFSLDLLPNEILCVVGESGSGKSLLAGAVMGLLPPGVRISRGSIGYAGQELTRLGKTAYNAVRGSRISMVFQEPMTALNPVLTV